MPVQNALLFCKDLCGYFYHMSAKGKKNTFIVWVLLGIVLVVIGFYKYNKGPVNVRNSSALKIEAAALYQAYLSDSVTAQKNYSGKILQVKGQVSKITDNQQGEMIVLFKTNVEGAFVNCTLQNKPMNIKPNVILEVKGICSGLGQGEPDLGILGDVYLTRSILAE
jgi:uncharacterized protein (DUF1330 family)